MINKTKILIVRLSAIGDVVHVLPAMRALRANFPDAYIGWLVEDRAKDLITGHPDLDEVIVYPRKKWVRGILSPLGFFKTIKEVFRFFRLLRGWQYDIAIDFQGNLKSGALTFLSGAKKRIGFARGHCKEFNYLFTNCHVCPLRCHSERSEESPNETLRSAQGDNNASEKKASKLHKIDKDLTLLKPLDITNDNQEVDLPVSQPDREYITNFLNNIGLNPPTPTLVKGGEEESISKGEEGIGKEGHERLLVVIHPGVSEFGAYKRWPDENYAHLGDMLVDEFGANVVFTWYGAAEYDAVKKIVSLMGRHGVVACDTSSIKQLVELIRLADLFIGGDTGPTQIASILGTPVVAIFGPKDPAIYGPRSTNSVVVRRDVPCSPCEKRICDQPICMELIGPEDVFKAASQLIKGVGV